MSEDWSLSKFSDALSKAGIARTRIVRIEIIQYEENVEIENLKVLETHTKIVNDHEANIFLWGFLNHLDHILGGLSYIWQSICQDRRETNED